MNRYIAMSDFMAEFYYGETAVRWQEHYVDTVFSIFKMLYAHQKIYYDIKFNRSHNTSVDNNSEKDR